MSYLENNHMKKSGFTAVDLFSGAGGISLGLEAAGFDVRLGSDIVESYGATYQANFPKHSFLNEDIRKVTGKDILKLAHLKVGELDVLAGGPPCQGFSIIGSRLLFDPRNDLFKEFLRIAGEIRPRAIIMENVPGLATLGKGQVLGHVLEFFKQIDYKVNFAELLAAQYGVPQMRWRMLFVAFRSDVLVPNGAGFPRPTHGKNAIGDLVPNRTITEEETAGFITAFDAIGDLPPLGSGQEVELYSGKPTTAYQKLMRKGLKRELFNHYAPKLSEQNLVRIRALKPGQDWRDLPFELLPDGMKRAKRKDHTRRYSRMTWPGIPRSIITRFRDPKSGEYTHPEQHRTISIREGARIQSFPDWFIFKGSLTDQYDQVGNAVPPILLQAVAQEVASCLSGKSNHILSNQFNRRRSLMQSNFTFDPV